MKQSRPPLVRIQYIDQQLKENRYPNCSRVAGYFEVSTKSIQRDIEYMRDVLHAPIAYDQKNRGYFYESPGWGFLPSAIWEQKEAEALMATKKVLAQYQGTPYHAEVCRALDKVRQYLPEHSAADEFFRIYSIEQSTSLAIEPRIFATIENAIRSRLKISMTYRASWNQEVSERTVHPYTLRYSPVRDTWYLIAFCELRNDIRTFALGRIRTISLTSRHFTVTEGFSLETYLDKTFDQIHENELHVVSIRFTPYQAQWIREHRWHPTQSIIEHEHGGLTLTMKVGALEAIKRWIMRYGSEAEVLEPQELREMIKYELLTMERMYEDVRAVKLESLSLF
ncbi:MAG: WYL domain-containing protein [Chlorobiaceae bacterium]|nr:WYL domain-containing protein [Chlorobiaceae bacterium]